MPSADEAKPKSNALVKEAREALIEFEEKLQEAREIAGKVHADDPDVGADAYARTCADFIHKSKQLRGNFEQWLATVT